MSRYFDPEARIREKQAARDRDEEDLRSGRASAAEIQARNNFFAGFDVRGAKIVIRNRMR